MIYVNIIPIKFLSHFLPRIIPILNFILNYFKTPNKIGVRCEGLEIQTTRNYSRATRVSMLL